MRLWFFALGGWALLSACPPAEAASGGNCVAYAREITGVRLDGDAASWWPHAEGRYDRGHRPSVGAILVFKPYGGMHVGHVAVVSRVVGAREVLVDQANWVRGRVTHAMSVVDASPLNDWTSVKVQFAGTHGRENPTFGFIYPRVVPASFDETIVEPSIRERAHPVQAIRADAQGAAQQGSVRRPEHDTARADSAVPDKAAPRKLAKADTVVAKADAPKAHRRDRHEPADRMAEAAVAPAHRLAANEPAHPKHKVPEAAHVSVY